jgi:hypothetical protein
MYNLRNTTTVNYTYLLAWSSVEYNQKSVTLCLHTVAGSSSHTPAAAYSLNLQAGKDQAAADAAKLNLQPDQEHAAGKAQLNLQTSKDQVAADAAKLNLQPDQKQAAGEAQLNLQAPAW